MTKKVRKSITKENEPVALKNVDEIDVDNILDKKFRISFGLLFNIVSWFIGAMFSIFYMAQKHIEINDLTNDKIELESKLSSFEKKYDDLIKHIIREEK